MSSVYARRLAQSYLDRMQGSSTLDLAQDCLRFVAGYFELISASCAHIYHSALVVAPRESIVRQLYQSHARPLMRVVHGTPTSWDPNTASASCPSEIMRAVWSPCSRFIAISWGDIPTIDVLDSVTLQRLQSFRPLPNVTMWSGVLIFSPDARILTYHGIPDGDHEQCVSSWDLQTGGLVSTITLQGPESVPNLLGKFHSIAHSASGGIIGVFHWVYSNVHAIIYDVTSGAYMHSYSVNNGIPLSYGILTHENIWTHGDSFRFATAHAATITIWEVGFTPGATCMEVETLRIPVEFVYEETIHDMGRHPSLLFTHTFGDMILLACGDWERIQVWDLRNSKRLLDCEDARPRGSHGDMSFSSNGHFFVCTAHQSTYIWKESPTGYALHRILPSSGALHRPLLSPNGESIVTFNGLTIQLWRTTNITTPPSGALTRGPQHTKSFVLDFSPDEMLAVVTTERGDTIMVLNLESGAPQLTIDAGMKVYGLRVTGNTVVVVGSQNDFSCDVISWNLPAGDCVPGARVNREDGTWTVNVSGWWFDTRVLGATISSDLRYVALTVYCHGLMLDFYSASTGERLHFMRRRGDNSIHMPWFTPDGSDVWCVAGNGEAEAWRVGERGEPECLELAADIGHPPEGYPWVSSRGYRVTNDWWILGPDGKRLLLLPPPWQDFLVYRVWKGRFLALLHSGLPEAVILEMEP